MHAPPATARFTEIFVVFLRLGLTSFGGPIAHLAYFRDEFVVRRAWLEERTYADLVALCQFLPGPASSQVGLALGLLRGGYPGALLAWCGFTLPSALLLILFALGLGSLDGPLLVGIAHGLKIVAVAVVAQAVWSMARNLCPDPQRVAVMLFAACALLLVPGVWTQLATIVIAGLAGIRLCRPTSPAASVASSSNWPQRGGSWWLLLFTVLLFALPVLAESSGSHALALIDAFYRAGSLVFGGGHVVLPMLQAEIVPRGWLDASTFLAGYGAAQAVPGPLFTFAAFLGAAQSASPDGWPGGLLCLFAIFLPAFLLLAGALPFWQRWRSNPGAQASLAGINAAVVGILLAALYDPLWTGSIVGAGDFALALLAFCALTVWRQAPWRVVLACALLGAATAWLAPLA